MKLHALHCGGEIADMAMFDPFHPEVGKKVTVPYFAYLVEHPQGLLLFDTAGHRDLIADPAKRLGAAAADFEVVMEEGDDVVSRLAQIGVTPDQIDHVANSHLHYDHAGGNEFFSDATFYVQERELQFAFWPPVYQRDLYLKADFDHDFDWMELDGTFDVFGDGKVILFPTPGHTAGHQSMLVRLPGGSVICCADASYLPYNIETNTLPGILWSPDAMVASWKVIRGYQHREDALLLMTHDLAFETTTKVAPGEWYE